VKISKVNETILSGYDIQLNNLSRVVLPDILVDNGVLHGLNQTLIPSIFNFTLFKSLKSVDALLFLTAIKKTGFEEVLNKLSNYTVFAPNDEALDELEEISDVLDTDNQVYLQQEKILTDFLKLHVVNYSIGNLEAGKAYYPLLQNYVLVPSSDAKKIELYNTSFWNTKPRMEISPFKKGFLMSENEEGIRANQTRNSAFVLRSASGNGFVVYELDYGFVPKEIAQPKASYGWLVVIIGMVVLVTFALIGYYIYRRRQAFASDVRLLD